MFVRRPQPSSPHVCFAVRCRNVVFLCRCSIDSCGDGWSRCRRRLVAALRTLCFFSLRRIFATAFRVFLIESVFKRRRADRLARSGVAAPRLANLFHFRRGGFNSRTSSVAVFFAPCTKGANGARVGRLVSVWGRAWGKVKSRARFAVVVRPEQFDLSRRLFAVLRRIVTIDGSCGQSLRALFNLIRRLEKKNKVANRSGVSFVGRRHCRAARSTQPEQIKPNISYYYFVRLSVCYFAALVLSAQVASAPRRSQKKAKKLLRERTNYDRFCFHLYFDLSNSGFHYLLVSMHGPF